MTHSSAATLQQPPAAIGKSKAFTISAHVVRVVLGAIFFVFGLNGFFHFIPMPPPTGTAADFTAGLAKAGYFFPLIAFIQVAAGTLLLSGSLIPFALLLLFPITVNILFFHLFLSPDGLGMAVFVVAANLLLAVHYWPAYKSLFQTANAWKVKKLKGVSF